MSLPWTSSSTRRCPGLVKVIRLGRGQRRGRVGVEHAGVDVAVAVVGRRRRRSAGRAPRCGRASRTGRSRRGRRSSWRARRGRRLGPNATLCDLDRALGHRERHGVADLHGLRRREEGERGHALGVVAGAARRCPAGPCTCQEPLGELASAQLLGPASVDAAGVLAAWLGDRGLLRLDRDRQRHAGLWIEHSTCTCPAFGNVTTFTASAGRRAPRAAADDLAVDRLAALRRRPAGLGRERRLAVEPHVGAGGVLGARDRGAVRDRERRAASGPWARRSSSSKPSVLSLILSPASIVDPLRDRTLESNAGPLTPLQLRPSGGVPAEDGLGGRAGGGGEQQRAEHSGGRQVANPHGGESTVARCIGPDGYPAENGVAIRRVVGTLNCEGRPRRRPPD